LFMAGARLAEATARLVAAGKPGETPAAVIARATLPDQQVVVATLDRIAALAEAAAIGAPALVVVGPTVALRAQLANLHDLAAFTLERGGADRADRADDAARALATGSPS
ncbi:MAG TPA: hypothetical protein VHE35_31300, partial [Kofleriaceae bacterium]|nr:hypothetical protein [Kofleriaceae bacterium]